jgi:stage II sporulation protein AB (anti-sigma F factor)
MLYENNLSLKFSAINENESFARLAIASFCSSRFKSIEDIADIKTVVSEAVTNAIVHGYEGKDGLVTINCKLTNDEMIIEVIDEGVGIENIEKAKMPFFTTKPELERSGMGFTVMEGFIDKMEIYSNVGSGTKVVLYKKIPSINDEK